MTPPRLVRIITRLNVGGPARQAVSLTERLPALGYDCDLVTGVEAPEEGRIPPTTAVTVVGSLRRDIDPRADVRAARALTRIVGEREPQIVHTHLAKAGALGRLAAHRCGTPVILHTFHGHVLDGYFGGLRARAFIEVERRCARWSDALVAVSDAVRDDLLELGIGRLEQWKVIPVGLDLSGLAGTTPDPARARRALGLPASGRAIGIVGRLVPIKDHDTFFRSAERLAADRPDVTFAVVGDGERRGELERSPARRRLGDRVVFTGWVDDLPLLYAALDVVVLTSRNEGTPVALIEAGAAGKPVVATRVGGVPDVVGDGVTGELVEPGDAEGGARGGGGGPAGVGPGARGVWWPPGAAEGVAGAVGRLLDDPALARARGAAARTHVLTRFDRSRLERDLDSLYRELLERSIRSPRPRRRRPTP